FKGCNYGKFHAIPTWHVTEFA
uniref:Uncharacterized protein n=1 Tax=Amphimedon queenslandica TaxID=400682 RepID=A0A1X7UJL3_AMPQE